jgi:hypothetical protein
MPLSSTHFSGFGGLDEGPPGVEQETGDRTTTNLTSDSVIFPTTTGSGRGIILCFGLKNGRSVSSITDNHSNTYTRAGFIVGGSDARAEIWYAQNITGGATHTITVNYDAAAYAVWGALEVSRINKTGFHDSSALRTFARGTVGGATSVSVTSGVPAAKNELFVGMLALSGGGATAGIITPTGFTKITQFNDYTVGAAGNGARRVNPQKSALTATWNMTLSSAPAAAMIAAFRASDAA